MSYTKALPLLLLVLAGCTSVSTQKSSSTDSGKTGVLGASADAETELYRKAITSLNNSQLEQAETELRLIIKTRPEFAGPWINLALIDLKKKNLVSAEKNLAVAQKLNPKMPQVYNVHGYVEMAKGNVKKAADDYRHALAIKEDYAIAHYNLALLSDTYYQDVKVAVRHYKRYLELTDNQDKKTADWVLELERMIAKGTE
jgi:Flp pilus assembly protein TadD